MIPGYIGHTIKTYLVTCANPLVDLQTFTINNLLRDKTATPPPHEKILEIQMDAYKMRRHHQVQIPSKQGSKRVLLIQSHTSALLHEVAALKTSPMNAYT